MSAGTSTSIIIESQPGSAVTPTLLQQITEAVITDIGKIFCGQLMSIIVMPTPVGKPAKLRLELNSEETKKQFEHNWLEAASQDVDDSLPYLLVVPPTKTKSILLTQVPSTWDQFYIAKRLFNEQDVRLETFKREEKEVNNTKYYTGRVWIGIRPDEFNYVRKVPTKIKVPGTKNWYVNVHLTKKGAKRKPRTCPLCKQTGTDIHLIQQCKKGTPLSPFKHPSLAPKKSRQRTQSVSDETDQGPDPLDKDKLKMELKDPTSNTSKRYRNYLRRHLDHAEHRYDNGTLTKKEAMKIIDDFKMHIFFSKRGDPPDKQSFNGFCDYLKMTYPEGNT